jgi:VWFA-related protein
MTSRCDALAVVGLLALASSATRTEQFSTTTHGVRLDILALDGRSPLAGLSREHFEVRDNGVPQEIDSITTSDAAHVVVALDASGSVQGPRLRRLIVAANALLRAATSKDRVTLVGFSHHVRLLLPTDGALKADVLPGGGSTALHDAVFSSLVLASDDSRPAMMILLTDGLDTASWLTDAQVLETAHQGDVVVYPVAVDYDAMQSARGWSARRAIRALQQLALDTGGRVVPVQVDRPLDRTFRDILAEYRQRYIITYTPRGIERKGWHAIEVRLRGARGTIQTRRGYLVP